MFKRAVITGASGMIASALIKDLVSQGVEVSAVCRPDSTKRGNVLKSGLVKIYETDLSDLKSLFGKLAKSDVFYHFAWQSPFGEGRNDCDRQLENVRYTLDAVELAENAGCDVFIGAGSQAEYGRKNVKLNSFTITEPENAYGAAKLAAGHLSRVKAQNMGIKHIWTRILSVYGPNDNEYTILQSGIRHFLKDKYAGFTKGEQQWDFLYCDDAAKAFRLIGEKGRDGAVYTVGSGEARKLSEYITIMRDSIDPSLPIGFGDIPYNEKQVMYLCADISELSEDTGFKPDVPFEDGIKRTIEWVRKKI
ncbi:MAG: NAD(P)-dependent oxidoreductase [Clostridia bacterium]|nr:NAD(P)-dependent oxidoreductase [Clostridia bacterium]